MKTIKVLGTGCTKCTKAAEIIAKVAKECGADVDVIKETNVEEIMRYQVMRTPAVVINDEVVHSGSIPSQEVIKQWFA